MQLITSQRTVFRKLNIPEGKSLFYGNYRISRSRGSDIFGATNIYTIILVSRESHLLEHRILQGLLADFPAQTAPSCCIQ